METKRLFFAMEAFSPWSVPEPKGRGVKIEERHLTLAFLGNVGWKKVENALNSFPLPPFKLSRGGYFDEILFLPHRHPHVAAWHAVLTQYQEILTNALLALAFHEGSLTRCFACLPEASSLEDVVRILNHIISIQDAEMGSCFKAVSYHGSFEMRKEGYLEWEMIVDV